MTAAEVLVEAARLGLVLRTDGDRVMVRPANALPVPLADEIRANRAEVLALLAAAPSCPACGSSVVDPADVLCAACHASRRAPGRVLAFDPTRRLRAEARLAERRCETCGGSWWRVNARGDAECESCRGSRAAAPNTGPATHGVRRGRP